MRDYLDGILNWIGAESLTDEEFDSIELEDTGDRIAVYQSLLIVLEDRESVSDMTSRLRYYFLASGIDFGDSPSSSAMSNIFVGAPLDED